jgi:hypothetical protein
MTTRFRTTLLVALACGAVVAAAGTDAPHAREALGQLKAGNDRFARNASLPVSLNYNRRDELAKCVRGSNRIGLIDHARRR